ncbi:hypothetical protein P175DRAFT_0341895 [Aspergillus ochraceoroseus IBT 24754]|uniref:Rhodopsin domain-containing protein n=1 Tax=Aspergillus ochraceoroseus IBT 24754 TaxID=1392256 RepID=A0A2T5LRU1_9EURO|nr:uncharacterized protein P175DRAFT_0341895 [Aspergillus ochraceoroseus IBT 24754]PTU19002.1 hypothetical protein P175DRAFT_0341895 [Aspergillus ochraceoroseus IBT 24754]
MRNQDYSGRGLTVLVFSDVIMFLAIIAVLMRLFSRYFILRTLGVDDWFALAALVVSIGMVLAINLGVKYGTGKHDADNNINTAILGKIRLAIQILYIFSSGLIKITILMLYYRLFHRLRIWVIITIAFVVVMSIAFTFVAVFQCEPVGRFWTTYHGVNCNCILTLVFWCIVAVIFLVSNLWITILPLKTILGLHLAWDKKITVITFLGSTGFITCVSAAVRLAYVVVLYKHHDYSRNSIPVYLCSVIEICVALIASSIPSLRSGFPKSMDRLNSWRQKASDPGSSSCTV